MLLLAGSLMSRPVFAVLLLFSLASGALAKDKKSILPAPVLNAQTIAVIINPGSEVPLANPGENRSARTDVEQALSKWGRFRLVYDPNIADLLVVVRKGRALSQTIGGPDVQNRPVVLDPGDSSTGIGVSTGNPRNAPNGGVYPQDPGPHQRTEVGPSDDTFELFMGQRADPLDAPAVWRYSAKNALSPPTVKAVDEFRKAVDAADKQMKQKNP
jgi:hypothetical protein